VSDDIFDKMWGQLGRIYTVLHDGLVPRAADGTRQPVATAFRETFGLQDTGRLSDTAAMDLRDEADAMRREQVPQPERRAAAETVAVESLPGSQPQQSVGDEIRSALRDIGPAITGALGDAQPAASTGIGPSDDAIKGDRRTEHEVNTEALLDRIADGIDRLVALFEQQVESTKEVVAETKSAGDKAEGMIAYLKKGIEILSGLVQLQNSQGNEDVKNAQKAAANVFFGTVTGTGAKLFP